ncbi:MAG TPA: hypothetical protein VGA69_06465 [Nitriliruptorales bacterium]
MGLLLGACAGGQGQDEPKRIVFSPGSGGGAVQSTGEGDTGGTEDDGGNASSEDGPADGGDGPEPEPVRTSEVHVVRLTADGHHLGADLGRVEAQRPAPGSDCDVGPDGYQMIQCELVQGSAGTLAVWTGQESSSRGIRVQVHRVAGNEFVLVAQSLLTRDFREVVVRVGRSAGEGYVLIEYELDRQGNVHDFDVVTWRSGQAQPGPVASLHQIVSPKVSVEGETFIEALNYGDGAELCCPNYKDVMELFLDPEHGWYVRVQTVPIEGR